MFGPNSVLVVGVEDAPDGAVLVYIGDRRTGIHTHVDDPAAKAQIKREWGNAFMGHLTADIPRTAFCNCPDGSGDQIARADEIEGIKLPKPTPDPSRGRP